MSVRVVTDSTADIPEELLEKHRIPVIPNLVIIGGKSLEDGKDITRQDFYNRLPTMNPQPTTSTASVGAFQRVYERLFEQGASEIVSIHAPSQLSGIFNAASAAAQSFGGRVWVIDSGMLSLGLGFQVIAAAQAGEDGAPVEAILETVDHVRRRARVVAMLDTLEYVRRSGRVSWARARIGNLLQFKIFVKVQDGQVSSLGEARTRQKGIARLMEFLRGLGELERLAILHTNAEADARQFLADYNPDERITPIVVHVTPVIGVHVGPNGLGFAVVVR